MKQNYNFYKNFGHRQLFKVNNNFGYLYRENLNARFISKDTKLPSYLIKTNSEGFRTEFNSHNFNKSKKNKILLIGCSFSAGDGIGNEDRFSNIVSKNKNVEIYNAAIPGTGNDQQFLILQYLLNILEPNIVILAPFSGCSYRNLVSSRTFKDPLHGNLTERPKPYFELLNNKIYKKNTPVPTWGIIQKTTESKYKKNMIDQILDTKNKLNYFQLKKVSSIFTGKNKYGHDLTKHIFKKIINLVNEKNIKLIIMPLPSKIDLMSNKQYVIANQNVDTLHIIMRSVFMQNAINQEHNIKEQINQLNNIIIEYSVPRVYSSLVSHNKYIRDASTLAEPLAPPKLMRDSKQLPRLNYGFDKEN